jgi:hypothetical protein
VNELLAYFPYFENIKSAYDIVLLSVCVCVCLSLYPPILARQRLGSVKVPLSLLGNGLVETLPR